MKPGKLADTCCAKPCMQPSIEVQGLSLRSCALNFFIALLCWLVLPDKRVRARQRRDNDGCAVFVSNLATEVATVRARNAFSIFQHRI